MPALEQQQFCDALRQRRQPFEPERVSSFAFLNICDMLEQSGYEHLPAKLAPHNRGPVSPGSFRLSIHGVEPCAPVIFGAHGSRALK